MHCLSHNVSIGCQNIFIVDGQWASWGSWQCMDDMPRRSRTCTNPIPENGGKMCSGSSMEQDNDKRELCDPGVMFSFIQAHLMFHLIVLRE